jgi:hypothetical protein
MPRLPCFTGFEVAAHPATATIASNIKKYFILSLT